MVESVRDDTAHDISRYTEVRHGDTASALSSTHTRNARGFSAKHKRDLEIGLLRRIQGIS